MGFKDWIRRNILGEEPPQGKIVLKRQLPNGGMGKVMDLATVPTIEEIFPHLEPGRYVVHQYRIGKSGFDTVLGPFDVEGDAKEEPSEGGGGQRRPSGTAMEQFVNIAKGLQELRNSAQEEFAVLAPFLMPQTEQKTLLEQIKEARADFEILEGIFGDKTKGSGDITYEGSVPIWFHPKLIPELIDGTLDKVEKRLNRWGLVEPEGTAMTRDSGLPEFPERPSPRRELPDKTDTGHTGVA